MAAPDSPWIAGIAGAAKAAAVGFALAGSLAAIAANPVASHSVSYASEGEATMMAAYMSKSHSAPASLNAMAGVAATLSQFGALPSVKIAVLSSPVNPKTGALFDGSSALPQGQGVCGLALVQGPAGQSTLAQILPADMGAQASPELAARLSTFEILHELGHCAQAQAGAQFSHPKLSAEQNKSVALGLAGNQELGEAWQESFADAYGMIKILESHKGDAKAFKTDMADGELIKAWRQMGRDGKEAAKPDGSLQFHLDANPYKTETALGALLANPAKYANASTPIEARAAELASIGLARAAVASSNLDQASKRAFDTSERMGIEMEPLASMLGTLASNWKKQGHSEADFMALAPKGVAAKFDIPDDNPFSLAAIGSAKEMAQAAWLAVDTAMTPEQAGSATLSKARERGLMASAAREFESKSPAAQKMAAAWTAALTAESGAPKTDDPAGPSALAAMAAQKEGAIAFSPDFYKQPEKLLRWRAAREATASAQPAPSEWVSASAPTAPKLSDWRAPREPTAIPNAPAPAKTPASKGL
jgi:hypothetical protein